MVLRGGANNPMEGDGGMNWKTTASAWGAVIFGFIAFDAEAAKYLHPLAIAFAKFACGAGMISLGHFAADKK